VTWREKRLGGKGDWRKKRLGEKQTDLSVSSSKIVFSLESDPFVFGVGLTYTYENMQGNNERWEKDRIRARDIKDDIRK
jgi:hypothetical protein